ncbi:MAG: helix-turn-helix domain-containing protein [Nanoarchaeota archaeon]|nr:helix-turn-helix domain-containing protein [Nanoarchaeota archaeon]MBU1270217.1 helix-turn-helix domain-containing protein [Nanoarchaeota archaeon]MBU1604581.1 helix-turn-helix domain-containing protein [Nanoarchaeota archaeon]
MAGKKETFLLVSLSEDKAKELAQVVSNDTCRKILDSLAESESTESDLAKKLALPISTVHYNLQQLMKGGLVVVEEFHYSEKGKEVNHYKLANKYIIIAPQKTWGLKEKLRKIFPVAAVTLAAAVVIEIGTQFTKGTSSATKQVFSSAADNVVAESVMKATAAPVLSNETVRVAAETVSSGIWQHAALWFLIGGFAALVVYLVVDWAKEK